MTGGVPINMGWGSLCQKMVIGCADHRVQKMRGTPKYIWVGTGTVGSGCAHFVNTCLYENTCNSSNSVRQYMRWLGIVLLTDLQTTCLHEDTKMIPSNIKKVVTDAIKSEATTGKKWLEVGNVVRTEYASAEALTAIKDEFLDEVIYPAMGDETVRIMRAEVPRKDSKEFIAASATQQAAWVAAGKAKISERGKGNSFFSRIRDRYAFPTAKDDDEKADTEQKATDDATYCTERTTQCIKRLQKSEAPPKHLKRLLEIYAEANKLLAEG